MRKDFGAWHKIKEWLNNRKNHPFFHEREVWWCFLGANVGVEQNGKGRSYMRPVLIFRKFNNESLWILPVTTQVKQSPFHLTIDLKDSVRRSVNLSQLRLIDAKRLVEKIGTIEESEYLEIQKAITILISQPPFVCHPPQ